MPTISTMVLAAALVASPEPADAFVWTPVEIPTRGDAAERFDWTPAAMPTRPDPDAPRPAPPVVVAPPAVRYAPVVPAVPFAPGPVYYAPPGVVPFMPAAPFGGGFPACPPGG